MRRHDMSDYPFPFPAEEDLAQFLTEEIKAEKDNQKQLPKLDGFKVEADGADLTFSKEVGGEKSVLEVFFVSLAHLFH